MAAALYCGTAAMGQTDLERFERQLEQIQRDTRLLVDPDLPAEARSLIEYGGYVTFGFAAIDDTTQRTHILRQLDLVGYVRVNLDGVHEFFLRGRMTYRDFDRGDSFDGNGDDLVEPTLDRGHYRFDLRRYMSAYEGQVVPYNVAFQGGRQLVHWANGLVLSQEIDGAVIDLEYEPVSLQILAGVSRDSTTDFDSSRPNFDEETHRGFYGAMLSVDVTAKHRPYIYGLVQVDNNKDDILTFGPTTTRFQYDSYYIGIGSRGSITDNLVYGVELVYQGGSTLSSSFTVAGTTATAVAQTEDNISAAAADFQLDYLFNDPNNSRVGLEVIFATGDTDRLHTSNTFGGNAPGTTDHAFNAFGLINAGLAFSPTISNIIIIRVGGSTFPLPTTDFFQRFQIGVNLYGFFKFDNNGPIDETTNTDSFLGFESDIYVNWQITSDVSLAIRYGIFFPGSAIHNAGANDDNPRHFFYTGLTFSF